MMEKGLLLHEDKYTEGEEEDERMVTEFWHWATVTGFAGEVKEEGQRIGYIAGPMVAVSLSQYFIQVVSNMMVGHLGELALSGAAVATSFATVTGFSLLEGMSCGLDTLCGQAYGAQQYKIIGTYTYAAMLSLILLCVPISVIWIYLGEFLEFIGQDPMISLEAGKYLMWMIPGLFAFAIIQCMFKFLQSQSLTFPMVLSSTLSLCLHIPLCWILVFKSSLGSAGAALSISITYWFNVLILGLYTKYSVSCKPTLVPFSRDLFKGISEFLRIALPSTMMMCLEWWSFELLVLLSGFLPNPKLETSMLSVCLTTIAFLYSIPYGLSNAASTRVSNELGAGNPEGAQVVVRVVMFVALTCAITVSVILYSLRRVVGYAYSNEKEVIDYVIEMAPVLCLQVIMDNLQGVLSGIARGSGWQQIGAYVNLSAYYLVGVPLALVLGFLLHMRGAGLRIGILGGATIQTVLLAIVTRCTDWKKQGEIARERIFRESPALENWVK